MFIALPLYGTTGDTDFGRLAVLDTKDLTVETITFKECKAVGIKLFNVSEKTGVLEYTYLTGAMSWNKIKAPNLVCEKDFNDRYTIKYKSWIFESSSDGLLSIVNGVYLSEMCFEHYCLSYMFEFGNYLIMRFWNGLRGAWYSIALSREPKVIAIWNKDLNSTSGDKGLAVKVDTLYKV